MDNQHRLSNVAKDYLSTYEKILDNMIQGMTEAPLTDSISHNFIVQMIPHHQAAIEMSNNILRYTTNVPLQDIASGIVEEQTKSIENMRTIEDTCGELSNSARDVRLYQRRVDQILHTMFTRMKHARVSNRIDCAFMWEMIPHHEGAVSMSGNALQFDICSGLTLILEAIISSQEKGIVQMQQLLKQLKC